MGESGQEGFTFTFFGCENTKISLDNKKGSVKRTRVPLLSEREILKQITEFQENILPHSNRNRPFTQRNYRMRSIDKTELIDKFELKSSRIVNIPRCKSFVNSKVESENSTFCGLKKHPRIARSGRLPQILRNIRSRELFSDQNLPIIGTKLKRL